MVTFVLNKQERDILTYWYYPENDHTKEPGIIIINMNTLDADILKIAELDFEREISVDELNEMAKAINQLAEELGEKDYVEQVDEPQHIIYYGDHAVAEICEYLKEGKIPDKGKQVWY